MCFGFDCVINIWGWIYVMFEINLKNDKNEMIWRVFLEVCCGYRVNLWLFVYCVWNYSLIKLVNIKKKGIM